MVHSVHRSECKQSEKSNQTVDSSCYKIKNNKSVNVCEGQSLERTTYSNEGHTCPNFYRPEELINFVCISPKSLSENPSALVKHKISKETHNRIPVLCDEDPDVTGLHLSNKYYNDILIIKAPNNINGLPVEVVTEKDTDNLQLTLKKNTTIISSPSILEKHRYHTTKNVVDEYVPENMIEEPMIDQIYISSDNLKFNSDPIKNNIYYDRKCSSYSKKGTPCNIISRQLEMPTKLKHFSCGKLPQPNAYRSMYNLIKSSPQQNYNRLLLYRINQLSPTLELKRNFTNTSGEKNLTYIQNQINKNLVDNLLKYIQKNIIRRGIKNI